MSGKKIPLFDEKNFSMWKSKDMFVEKLDQNMMYIIDNGLHISMFDKTKDDVKIDVIKKTPKNLFSEECKHLFNVDVRARAAIGISLLYDIYHLV